LIRFQADADLHHRIVVAIRQREPTIDFASAVDSGLGGVPDPDVLEIAARQGRILITHDRQTMLKHFRTWLKDGKSSPGVFLVVETDHFRALALRRQGQRRLALFHLLQT